MFPLALHAAGHLQWRSLAYTTSCRCAEDFNAGLQVGMWIPLLSLLGLPQTYGILNAFR